MKALTPAMQAAIEAIQHAEQNVFTSILWNDEKRFISVINGNTIRGLLRRGVIVEDHRDVYPEPNVCDLVWYRLVEA